MPSSVLPPTMSGSTALPASARGGTTCSKKAPPFVEVHDEHGAGPRRPLADRLEHVIEEPVAFADVGVRMVVVAGAVVQHGGARAEKRAGRKIASGSVLLKLTVGARR